MEECFTRSQVAVNWYLDAENERVAELVKNSKKIVRFF